MFWGVENQTKAVLTRHGANSYNQTLDESVEGECGAEDSHALGYVLPHLLLHRITTRLLRLGRGASSDA